MRIKKLDADITEVSRQLKKSKETYSKSISDKKYILMPRIFQDNLNRQKNENAKLSNCISDLKKENKKLKREMDINEIEGKLD